MISVLFLSLKVPFAEKETQAVDIHIGRSIRKEVELFLDYFVKENKNKSAISPSKVRFNVQQ